MSQLFLREYFDKFKYMFKYKHIQINLFEVWLTS